MDETETCYGKKNKPERKETNIAQYHLYVELKKKRKKEKSWTHGSRVCNGGCQGLGNGGNRERLIKQYKLQLQDEWFWGSNA